MRAVLAEPFVRSLIAAPPEIPKLFGKQLAHPLRDRRHRSLDAKKFPELALVWPTAPFATVYCLSVLI